MTDRNFTGKLLPNQSINVNDVFINNQGCYFKIIKNDGWNKILVEFQAKNKHRAIARKDHIKNGSIKNPFHPKVCGVGYFGVGVHRGNTFIYQTWRDMLKRCYDEKTLEQHPTYKGCTVCDEWHNFQNFAEWYIKQEFNGCDYCLDKDLLIDGNKIYSPETCVLAPRQINNLFLDSSTIRGEYPIGVCLEKRKNRFVAYIKKNGKHCYIGMFQTAEQASQAYQKAKKEYVEKVALEWQDRIDKRLFDALMARAS